jgi:hypothetical protein
MTTTFQKSYFTRATRVWNCLPTNLRQPNMFLSTFKRLLWNYYLEALHIVVMMQRIQKRGNPVTLVVV